jgi:hypothetical protein
LLQKIKQQRNIVHILLGLIAIILKGLRHGLIYNSAMGVSVYDIKFSIHFALKILDLWLPMETKKIVSISTIRYLRSSTTISS